MTQIPAGWEETTLQLCTLPVQEKISLTQVSEDNYISTENMLPNIWWVVISSGLPNINSITKFQKWDILFSNIRTYFRKLWYATFTGGVSNDVLVFRGNYSKIYSKFLFYRLSDNSFFDYTIKTSKWTKMPRWDKEAIWNFPIHLPPLPEQQAIAAVLSSFDDKIELLRAENQTLEQMGQELFKERFGKWKVGDELPEGWRVGKITEIIRREPISYKCDKKDLDDKGKTPILDQGTTGLYGYTSRDPDFIATKDNPVIIFTNHTCNFWFIDYPFCAIQNVLPYRWINGYDGYFLYFMTKGSIKFTEYKGHRPSFVALDFVIPPVELAQEFSKIAEGILKKISWNKEQIQTLSATRDQLLPKLMSGEVRVEF